MAGAAGELMSSWLFFIETLIFVNVLQQRA